MGTILVTVLGAIWRIVDGSDNAPKMWHLLCGLMFGGLFICKGF